MQFWWMAMIFLSSMVLIGVSASIKRSFALRFLKITLREERKGSAVGWRALLGPEGQLGLLGGWYISG